MNNAWKHFKTITYHKYLVAKGCFRVGLYWQGLVHDMSKYSPTEFQVGMRYFQGDHSPNDAERKDIGYSSAWLHHKGRNKHHFEYWIDYSIGTQGVMAPVPMPNRYIVEMIMDRIAACKVYKGKDYTSDAPLQYLQRGQGREPIHPETREKLKRMLTILAEQGEQEMNCCIKAELLGKMNQGDVHQNSPAE